MSDIIEALRERAVNFRRMHGNLGYYSEGDALLDERAADALAAIAHIEQAGGWQPITSAPKDGTKILLGKIVGHPDHPTALWWATSGYWSAKWHNWNDGIEPAGLAGPTHWALLPSKPRALKEQP